MKRKGEGKNENNPTTKPLKERRKEKNEIDNKKKEEERKPRKYS